MTLDLKKGGGAIPLKYGCRTTVFSLNCEFVMNKNIDILTVIRKNNYFSKIRKTN